MDVFLDIIDRICEWLRTSVLSPQFTDAMFCRGYFWGIITAVIFAVIMIVRNFVLMWLAKIRAFFQPSALPATRPGPSGYDRARGCGEGLLALAGLAIFLLILLAVAIAKMLH